MNLHISPYIKNEYYENIQTYKYKGADLSLTYKYFISPLCEYIITYIPPSIAPNTITTIGFFLNIFYFILTTYKTGLKGSNEIPSYICYISALSYFLYNILDNCDGKQARKTNSSSPLGLLIDHGTDACTTFFVVLGFGSIIGIDHILFYGMLYLMTSSAFYLSTWEEYIIGELILPIFNGVSDGMVILVFIEIFTGVNGVKFWIRKFKLFNFDIQFNWFLCFLGMIGGIFFSFLSVFNVLKKIDKGKIYQSFYHILFYFFYFFCFCCVCFYNKESYVIVNYPKIIILTFGFQFAKIMGLMQLSHIMKSYFNPYTFINIFPLFILMFYSIVEGWFKLDLPFNIDTWIWIILIYNLLSWLHFVYFCTSEMCQILNIKVFSIKSSSAEQVQEVEVKIENSDEKKIDV